MARSFLLSFLARKAAFNEQRFADSYPHCWLVLETSAKRAEQPVSNKAQIAATQQGILNQSGDWPPAGDALCFELEVYQPGARFTIGRGRGNSIEIIDESVSRDHLVLAYEGHEMWTVSAIANTSTSIDGKPISPGVAERLPFDAALKLGQAVLRLHDVRGMAARLKKRAAEDL